MAVYDLEEQEQIDELKTWWKMYGNLVTAIVVVAALAVIGWQGWQRWQASQSAEASQLFSGIEQAVVKRDAKQARQLAGELIDKYPGTAYAAMGALVSARFQLETDDARNAKTQLEWVAGNAKDDALRQLGQLRLAALLIDEKAYDEALKQLAAEPVAAFAPRFAELRGDVFAAQGKAAEARNAYDASLSKFDALAKDDETRQRGGYKEVIQTKRDSLGAAK
jgi:predicted negative regulator of RcsB-dependent stress response